MRYSVTKTEEGIYAMDYIMSWMAGGGSIYDSSGFATWLVGLGLTKNDIEIIANATQEIDLGMAKSAETFLGKRKSEKKGGEKNPDVTPVKKKQEPRKENTVPDKIYREYGGK